MILKSSRNDGAYSENSSGPLPAQGRRRTEIRALSRNAYPLPFITVRPWGIRVWRKISNQIPKSLQAISSLQQRDFVKSANLYRPMRNLLWLRPHMVQNCLIYRPQPPYSAAIPLAANISGPSSTSLPISPPSFALALRRWSKLAHTVFQSPRVAPFEYSVARVSKKFACSTPFSKGVSQGSGCSSAM